jgi:hypothetical protein
MMGLRPLHPLPILRAGPDRNKQIFKPPIWIYHKTHNTDDGRREEGRSPKRKEKGVAEDESHSSHHQNKVATSQNEGLDRLGRRKNERRYKKS